MFRCDKSFSSTNRQCTLAWPLSPIITQLPKLPSCNEISCKQHTKLWSKHHQHDKDISRNTTNKLKVFQPIYSTHPFTPHGKADSTNHDNEIWLGMSHLRNSMEMWRGKIFQWKLQSRLDEKLVRLVVRFNIDQHQRWRRNNSGAWIVHIPQNARSYRHIFGSLFRRFVKEDTIPF